MRFVRCSPSMNPNGCATMIEAHCVIRPRTSAALRSRAVRAALRAAQHRLCRCGGDHTKTDLHDALRLVREHFERINDGQTARLEKHQKARA